MSKQPCVSVVMPYYNMLKTLPMALASLRLQTFQDWECLLIDDGSEQCPKDLLSKINDPRIRYYKLKRNHGRGYARQVALCLSRGRYLAMLDSDDFCLPDKLQKQVLFLESNPDIILISSGIGIVDSFEKIIRIWPAGNVRQKQQRDKFFKRNIRFAASMIRIEAAKKVRFDRRLRFGCDYDYLLNLAFLGKFESMDEINYFYRFGYNIDKMYRAINLKDVIIIKFFKNDLCQLIAQLILNQFKKAFFASVFMLRLEKKLLYLRGQKPSVELINRYYVLRQNLENEIQSWG